jgi:hypothetical protein
MAFSDRPLELRLRFATGDDILAWRDRIVSEAAAQLERSQVREALDTLRKLEFSTIDARTLETTDQFLPKIAAGRKVVATFNPLKMPQADEIVIIYGNYPHMFGNVVVNNPIKRHVVDFWNFRHDRVESDPRWQGVDQIFIINADERPDRYDSVLRELCFARAPLDRVTRISALKGDSERMDRVSGTIGCLRSHIEVLHRALQANFCHCLVLEDDFCFTSDLEDHLTDLKTFFLRGYAYWICLIATSKYGTIVPQDDLVSLSFQPVTNAGGYLVSREGLERLLPVFEDALEKLKATGDCLSYAADRCWAVLQCSEQFLVFRRKFGFQISGFSDIEQSISRYLD